jgi:hypothetical protein
MYFATISYCSVEPTTLLLREANQAIRKQMDFRPAKSSKRKYEFFPI